MQLKFWRQVALFAAWLPLAGCSEPTNSGAQETVVQETVVESIDETEAWRTDLMGALEVLDTTKRSVQQAGEAIDICETDDCYFRAVDAFEIAIREEDHAAQEYDLLLGQGVLLLTRIVDSTPTCGVECSSLLEVWIEEAAASRLFSSARAQENALYLDAWRCENEGCLADVLQRLDSAVEIRADAANRLDDAQQRRLAAERDTYDVLFGS